MKITEKEILALQRVASAALEARKRQRTYFARRTAFALAEARNAEADLDHALLDLDGVRAEAAAPKLPL